MKSQIFKTWMCTLLLIVCALVSSQSNVWAKNDADGILTLTADGNEAWQKDVLFVAADSAYLLHERMLYSRDKQIFTLLPTEAKEVMRLGKRYISVETLLKEGIQKRIFALLTYEDAVHELRIFQRLLASGKSENYVQLHDGVLQYLDETNGKSNLLREYLIEQNAAQGGNAQIADYIGKVKASGSAVKECYDIIGRQNPNRIPRWRLGISAGMSANSFEINDGANFEIKLGSQSIIQPMGALYADYRMSNGLGAHLELTMQNQSIHMVTSNQVHDTIDIDRTMISVPLLVRYTMVNLRGKCLPYIEAGAQLNIALTNKNRHMVGERNGSGEVIGYTEVNAEKNGLAFPQPMCGVGIEYVMTPKRSLYLGARYLFPSTKDTGEDVLVKHSAWMLSLSVDIF